jgi:hypothetical protein
LGDDGEDELYNEVIVAIRNCTYKEVEALGLLGGLPIVRKDQGKTGRGSSGTWVSILSVH